MIRDHIRGLDKLSVGDILLHDGDYKTREYQVTRICLKDRYPIRISTRKLDSYFWTPCGDFDDSNGLFTRHMYFKSREVPYDPTQQGDQEDDI